MYVRLVVWWVVAVQYEYSMVKSYIQYKIATLLFSCLLLRRQNKTTVFCFGGGISARLAKALRAPHMHTQMQRL